MVQRRVEIPGLGKILLTRSSREKASARVDPSRLPDIGLKTLLRIDRIPRASATSAVVYRVTLDDDKPETALARDARQQIKKVGDKTVELHVKAVRGPTEEGKVEKAGKEFLESCSYLDSANAEVKELAAKAVGEETDPWRKRKRIERWVHANVASDNSVPFGPAGQIARQLRGDCRQHAMLAAALCRAAGVPSRTAVGLVYVEDRKLGPVLGFHMWFEVNVKDRWLALDAVFGEGSVGADHIKIADHSLARDAVVDAALAGLARPRQDENRGAERGTLIGQRSRVRQNAGGQRWLSSRVLVNAGGQWWLSSRVLANAEGQWWLSSRVLANAATESRRRGKRRPRG